MNQLATIILIVHLITVSSFHDFSSDASLQVSPSHAKQRIKNRTEQMLHRRGFHKDDQEGKAVNWKEGEENDGRKMNVQMRLEHGERGTVEREWAAQRSKRKRIEEEERLDSILSSSLSLHHDWNDEDDKHLYHSEEEGKLDGEESHEREKFRSNWNIMNGKKTQRNRKEKEDKKNSFQNDRRRDESEEKVKGKQNLRSGGNDGFFMRRKRRGNNFLSFPSSSLSLHSFPSSSFSFRSLPYVPKDTIEEGNVFEAEDSRQNERKNIRRETKQEGSNHHHHRHHNHDDNTDNLSSSSFLSLPSRKEGERREEEKVMGKENEIKGRKEESHQENVQSYERYVTHSLDENGGKFDQILSLAKSDQQKSLDSGYSVNDDPMMSRNDDIVPGHHSSGHFRNDEIVPGHHSSGHFRNDQTVPGHLRNDEIVPGHQKSGQLRREQMEVPVMRHHNHLPSMETNGYHHPNNISIALVQWTPPAVTIGWDFDPIKFGRNLHTKIVHKKLESFRITYHPINSRYRMIQEVSPSVRNITLDHLKPNTEYILRIFPIFQNEEFSETDAVPSHSIRFISPTDGASSLLHQLKSRPLFKKLSHKLNSTHAHLTHHGSSTYTVHVESEEIIIVSLVLIFWMVFIIIFIKKWGRIRHLEPCSFAPMSGSARCGSTDHALSKNHMSLEHRLSYHGHSYHNNLNACANSMIGNSRKGSFNPLAINPKLMSAVGSPSERHLSVPNCNLSARCRSVSPDGQVSSLLSSPSALWKRPLTITGHSGPSFPGQTSVFDHSPVPASGWNQLTPFRVNSLPNDRRNRKKETTETKERTNDHMEAREGRMSSDPRQMRELEQEQKNDNSFSSSSDSTNESLEQNHSKGKRGGKEKRARKEKRGGREKKGGREKQRNGK